MSKSTVQDRVVLEAAQQYGWKPKSVKSIGNVWKIKCENGVYALKRAKASREKLLLLHRILGQISSHFPHILPWIKTQEGSPVVSVGGVSCYATPWIEDKGARKVPSARVVKNLALFHQLAESVVNSYPELRLNFADEKLADWQQNGEIVRKYREKREAREFQSPFDKCFSRSEEMLERVVDFSVRGMEKFFELEKGKAPRFTLCHNRFHPRHVIQDENNFYFINFDHAQVQSPILDIAVGLRRLSEPGDDEHPLELFEAYDSTNKLLPMEKKLLALFLAYPERLLKTVDHYYGETAGSQNEITALRRLEKEVTQLEQFEELIKSLWNTKRTSHTLNASIPKKVAGKRRGKKVKT